MPLATPEWVNGYVGQSRSGTQRPIAIEESAICPASFAQRRLWFLQCLDPASPAYNMVHAFRLEGALEVGALEGALDEIVRRHDTLRTTFIERDGEPCQVVAPFASLALRAEDLSALPERARDERIREELDKETDTPFDLAAGPLVRARLIRARTDAWVLVLCLHHIVSDQWSVGVLLRELGVLYRAFLDGEPSPLEDPAIQYTDYASWQRQRLRGDAMNGHLAYWRRQLAGLPLLEVPGDRPRTAMLGNRGAKEKAFFPPALLASLERLAGEEHATLFMLTLAAFNVLLHRITGQDDLAVGTPVTGRVRAETESLIGFFVNTLVIRTDHAGGPTFRELLQRVRQTALDAYEHQDLPFERLIDELHPERDVRHTPLCQVMFAFTAAGKEPLVLPGLRVRPMAVDRATSKFDLTLFAHRGADGLHVALEYRSDLYRRATARRLLGHLGVLLDGIARDPDRPIGRLPLLTEDERRQILGQWSGASSCYPRDACIDRLFEEVVEAHRDAPAVREGDRAWTYGELDDRARGVARDLRRHGLEPGDPVAVCVAPSLDLVAGLLGVLQAGGVYVPLDPEDAAARRALMLDDAGAKILLTQRALRRKLAPGNASVLYMEDIAPAPDATREREWRGGTSEDPAYIMYTSGSTGRPKGVVIPHRAIVRLVRDTNYITLGPADRIAQVSNCAFDAATFEIWGALLNGACLDIISRHVVLSPDALAEALEARRITALFVTSALFNQVVRERPDAFRDVGNVLVGGEAVSPECMARALRHGPPRRLLNAYGPTENTTFSTWHEVRDVPADGGAVPIGRPVSNSRVYLLDASLQPVPVGVTGEIYLGGDGLAVEYLNRPELNATAFVPDPFGNGTGRLYKTGDLARFLPDGALVFLGRADRQIKLRGFRVEPGEIESVLREHPAVRDAIVRVEEDLSVGRRLTAHVLPAPGPAPTNDELRDHLREKLPPVMIPRAYVLIDDWPRLPSGKIDRHSLPAATAAAVDGTFVAPRDTVEQDLADIWKGVLGVKGVGAHDSFFDLGGHSLLAVRLFSEIKRIMGVDLPLATLFQSGATLAALAQAVRTAGDAAPASTLVALQPHGRGTPFYCVPGAGSDVSALEPLARHLGAERPFFGLQYPGTDGVEAPSECIEELAERHLREVRAHQPEGPYCVGGTSGGGIVAFELARQLAARGSRVALLALLDTHGPGYPVRRQAIGVRLRARLWLRGLLPVAGKQAATPANLVAGLKQRYARWAVARSSSHSPAPVGVQPHEVRYLQLLEGFIRAGRRYVARPFTGTITLFRTAERPPEELFVPDPAMGWGGLAEGGVAIVDIPGHHGAHIKEPHVEILAARLHEVLRDADRGVGEQ